MPVVDTQSDLLIRTGEALYGDRWATALADDIMVNERTVRRWASGAHPIPVTIWDELAVMVAHKLREVQLLLADINATSIHGSQQSRVNFDAPRASKLRQPDDAL